MKNRLACVLIAVSLVFLIGGARITQCDIASYNTLRAHEEPASSAVSVEFATATTSDLVGEVDDLMIMIQDSQEDCWRNPSDSRKDSMANKLTALRALVEEELFDEAYDILLYDIKPKLTGLKTDENEEPWAEDIFKNPWVICNALSEEFRVPCNEFLSHLEMGSVYDDDDTPPTISIVYIGDGNDGNPGSWNVLVEDPESGLDEVKVLVDGNEYLYDQDLTGIQSASYEVPVPTSLEWQVVQVTAVNYDMDWDNDQESSSEEAWICLVDDDTSPPTISINYYGRYDTNDPGFWLITLEDVESGLSEVTLLVDGTEFIYELSGIQSTSYEIPVEATVGVHTVTVSVKNYDTDWDGDQESDLVSGWWVYINPPPDGSPPIIIG